MSVIKLINFNYLDCKNLQLFKSRDINKQAKIWKNSFSSQEERVKRLLGYIQKIFKLTLELRAIKVEAFLVTDIDIMAKSSNLIFSLKQFLLE